MGSNLLGDFSISSCPFQESKLFSSRCTIEFVPSNFTGEYKNGDGCKREDYFEEIQCPRYLEFEKQIINKAQLMEEILLQNPNREFRKYTCPYSIKKGFVNEEFLCIAQNNKSQNPVRVNLFCKAYYKENIKLMETGKRNPGCLNAFTLCEFFQQAQLNGEKFPGELSPCQYYDSLDKTCLIQEDIPLSEDEIKNHCFCRCEGEGKRKCEHFQNSLQTQPKKRTSTLGRVMEMADSKLKSISERNDKSTEN